MKKKKPFKPDTLARMQGALKGVNGYDETAVVIYANHTTYRFQNGVVGSPNVLHTIWDYMLSNYDKGIADNPTKMIVQTMLTAIAMHYEPEQITEILGDIRKQIQDINNKMKN